MWLMRRREPPCREWPPAQGDAPETVGSYAPETVLVPGTTPGEHDDEVRSMVLGLPDGVGSLSRVGICNGAGAIYREVALRGPVQLLYLWAGLNAIGFRQCSAQERAFSKYSLLFDRAGQEKRPLEGGRK
jgi:hypothetical protein